eukprot:6175609-Pleurochrysis_carterae.AAC.5
MQEPPKASKSALLLNAQFRPAAAANEIVQVFLSGFTFAQKDEHTLRLINVVLRHRHAYGQEGDGLIKCTLSKKCCCSARASELDIRRCHLQVGNVMQVVNVQKNLRAGTEGVAIEICYPVRKIGNMRFSHMQ